MNDTIADSRIHDGHRQRMRAKLVTHGQKIFDTYELLEMLLYCVIPYKDTNPIAKRLLAKFGDLDGVLRAGRDEMLDIPGVGTAAADLLTRVGSLAQIIGAETSLRGEMDFSDYRTVGEYLVGYFSGIGEPRVIGMFFDNNMRLLGMEPMYDLDYSSGGVKAKHFLDIAIKKHASVVISAHHHPHGPFYPSQGDIATNNTITSALGMAGILHAEHYLVCGDMYAGLGSLNSFINNYSHFSAIDGFMKSRAYAVKNGIERARTDVRLCFDLEEACNSETLEYFTSLLSTVSAKPREVALGLLGKYGTVEGAMTAPFSELSEAFGEKTAFYIKLLAYVSSRRVTEKMCKGTLCTPDRVAEYFKAAFLGQSVELVYFLTLDKDNRLISSSIIGEGTVSTSDVLPRKALEIAVADRAAAVIIAHNHPFGKAEPSSDDVRLTNAMNSLFAACEIKLKAHYIIAGQLHNVLSVNLD